MKTACVNRAQSGMTRLEVLIVASLLIAVALTVVRPGTTAHPPRPKYSWAASSANGIHKLLFMYAMDNDRGYPSTEEDNSNAVFRLLFVEGVVTKEDPFFVPDSPFCNGEEPDNILESDSEGGEPECLKPGENHWAYVNGLEFHFNEKNPRPIIADGFTDPNGISYDHTHPWIKERRAIVVFTDGHVEIRKLSRTTNDIRDKHGRNLFGKNALPKGANLLNPARKRMP